MTCASSLPASDRFVVSLKISPNRFSVACRWLTEEKYRVRGGEGQQRCAFSSSLLERYLTSHLSASIEQVCWYGQIEEMNKEADTVDTYRAYFNNYISMADTGYSRISVAMALSKRFYTFITSVLQAKLNVTENC